MTSSPTSGQSPTQISSGPARTAFSLPASLAAYRFSPGVQEFFKGSHWVFAAFVGSRLLILGVMALSRTIMVRAAWWHPGGLLSVLTQWDGELWYIQIARHGYGISSGDHLPHAFFPMYPILIKLASFVFRDLRIAALVTSHLCLLSAGLLLSALIRLDYKDGRVSRAAVMLFMFNPASFFYSNAYSESTFFMFATGALFAARKGYWLPASLCGMCLSASRPPGFLISLPLFMEYVRQFHVPGATLRSYLRPRLFLLALVPSGLGAYMLYEYIAFGDPLAFSHAARIFGRAFVPPWRTIAFLQTYTTFYYLLFLGTLIANLLLLAGGVWLRIRLSYLAFASALLLLYLCSATFEAFPRYVSVEFPIYIILGALIARHRWCYEPLFAASIFLLTLLTVMSANGYWMT